MTRAREYYLVTANRRGGFHTYERKIAIRSVEDTPRAYTAARKIADTASRRGYSARVTKFVPQPTALISLVAYEVAEQILPPWSGAR